VSHWLRLMVRWAARALLALLLASVLVAALAGTYLSTEHGRGRLLRAVVRDVNHLLPGTVEARELTRLTPTTVELRDLSLRARGGNEVVRLARARARLAPWALLQRRIVIEELVLENASVDLRAIDDPELGLVPAVVPPSDGAPSDGGSTPDIVFGVVRIENCQVRVPTAIDAGPDELWVTSARVRLTIDAELGIDVQQLRARVRRDNMDMGGLRASAQLRSLGRSHVELGATLRGVELDADLAAGADGQALPDWPNWPFTLELEVRELTAARLARLTGTPPLPLLGVYAARFGLGGTPAAFEAQGSLRTPAGALVLHGNARELSQLDVSAQTDGLTLGDLASGLPARSLAGELEARLERRDHALHASVTGSTRVDGVAMPRLSVRAAHTGESPSWQLELGLEDRWLNVTGRGAVAPTGALSARANGWVDPANGLAVLQRLGIAPEALSPFGPARSAGAERVELRLDLARSATGALEANAELGARRLRLDDVRVERLSASLFLAGQLPRPRLRLKADWHAALEGSAGLLPGRLELEGGPTRYRFELQGGQPGAASASGWFEREAQGERFALTAGGRYRGAPWRVAVQPSLLLGSGSVVLPGVDIEVDGQKVHARGQYAGRASRLLVELDDVDIRRALAPFLPGTRLMGKIGGRIDAHGALERPSISLGLRASGCGLEGAPTLDSNVAASLDLAGGTAALDVTFGESIASSSGAASRLLLRLSGGGHFDPRRGWPALLATGEQRVELEVKRLDGTLLSELTGGSAGGALDVHGKAELRLAAGVPSLDSRLEGRLTWTGAGSAAAAPRARSAQLLHSLSYADRELRTELTLDDELGRWVSLSGDATLPESRAPTLVALASASTHEVRRWLEALGWQLKLEAASRATEALPDWLGRPDLGGAKVGLALTARGEPGRAPQGTLAVDVADAGGRDVRHRCASQALTTKARLALASHRFQATIEAFGGKTRLLRATTAGELDLYRWLDGAPPSWQGLTIDLNATKLPLEGLPFACGKLRGELTARGTIRDPFGAYALDADLAMDRFSLGSEQTVDIQARVAVDPKRVQLSGAVTADGRRSPLSMHWSRAAGGPGAGQDVREASFEFAQLPLAPLLPLHGPISHVSGYISGQLRSQLAAGARKLAGSVRFDQVALTVTELAQPLSDIGGEITFADGAVIVKNLDGRDGDGELTLNGRIEPHGGRAFDADVTLVSRRFPMRQAGDVVARTTATARLQASWRPELQRLRVSLKDFDTWLERREGSRGLSLAAHPDVTLKARAGVRPQLEGDPGGAAADGASGTPLIVELDAPEQFWVKRADFALKLSASLQVAVGTAQTESEQGDVSVTGELRFERGYMEMMGKSFEVKRGGRLRFTGGTAAVLDLSAEYEDRRTDKLVSVHLQGSADAPRLDFQVDGRTVSAGEAFQAIYGSNASSDDVDPEAQADQIIGALMAGVLTTSMRRRLGAMAPILSVDAADEDRGEQLRAGFELDALIPEFLRDIVTGVYVEGSISSEKQADQAGSKDVQTGVLIELHFPYNLVSSGRYGPDTTWSVDLGWQP
jgi:translocation-and-assembly-module (TAM) inner membrane subunit TamB-like protein